MTLYTYTQLFLLSLQRLLILQINAISLEFNIIMVELKQQIKNYY